MGQPLEEKQERFRKNVQSYLKAAGTGYRLNPDNLEEDAMYQLMYEVCWYGIDQGFDLESMFHECLDNARAEYPYVD